ncbi:unnamed protein product [Blepharisma stoltei]|uniref:Cyclic nucleotide-binding domain-containing protein n=1 Tax=Blepharisma stoltei TaxID=1481888 RepID=A0AAU9JNT7_9CILI|nr:unnamed protein product [Blepharisma stoltei]
MEQDAEAEFSLSNLIIHSNSEDPKSPNAILKPQKQITAIDFIPKANFELMWDKNNWNGKYLIHAESYWKLTWDIFILFSLILQGIYVPFAISFDVASAGFLIYYDFIVSLAFIVDIIFNFNTGFFKRGILIMNRKLIAWNYLKTWFILDILSSFPYSWIIQGGIFQNDTVNNTLSATRLLRTFRIPRFIKILRLIKFAKIKLFLVKIEDNIFNDYLIQVFHFFRFIIVIFTIAHWLACLWHYTGVSQGLSASNTWVNLYEEKDVKTPTKGEMYVTSLYWAITTLLTIGYGDIHAQTTPEKIVAMISMVFASAFYGFALGSIHEFVERTTLKERKHRESIIAMTNHMRRKRIPKELQFKVRNYLEYVYENQKNINIREDEILNLLSEPLKDEITAYIHYPAIKSCPIFMKYLSLEALSIVLKNLREETYAPDDEIFSEGEKNRTIYIIIEGSIFIYYKQFKTHLADLRKGDYFGEIGFFAGHPRTASAHCAGFADLLSLKFEDAYNSLYKDTKSQEVLMLIQSACRREDYSEIGVSCYICQNTGHVATKCSFLSPHNDQAKKQWLAKNFKGLKKINPHDPSMPKLCRKSRVVKRRIEANNILGIKRTPEEMYKNDDVLRRKVSHYLNISKPPISVSTTLSEASLKQDTVFEIPTLYRYSMILPDTLSDEDEDKKEE